MTDLVERLNAAIDEEQRIAREAAEEAEGAWRWGDPGGRIRLALMADDGRVVVPVAQADVFPAKYDAVHIVRHDPARVLRQVAAHRKILAAYVDAVEHRTEVDAADPRSFEDAEVREVYIACAYATVEALELVVVALAEAYGIEP